MQKVGLFVVILFIEVYTENTEKFAITFSKYNYRKHFHPFIVCKTQMGFLFIVKTVIFHFTFNKSASPLNIL